MGENGQSFKQGSKALLGSDRRVNGSSAIGSLSTGSPVGSSDSSGGLNVQSGHSKHRTSCELCLCDQECNEKLSLGSTGGITNNIRYTWKGVQLRLRLSSKS